MGSSVRRLITVTSCKGGVGKSTVSLELAYRLAGRGHRVGLFDADVHGPSLPSQMPHVLSARRVELTKDGLSVLPIDFDNLKMMSFGWLCQSWNRRPGAEIRVRAALAPLLLQTTRWGELDWLVIDSPPGTGDIPIALATKLPLHGAVVVTTPSKLSAADVVRGIQMLKRLKVPILAIVENMASFRCTTCENDHFPFGRGHMDEILSSIRDDGTDLTPTFSLPILADVGFRAAATSHGSPKPSSSLSGTLDSLVESLENSTAGSVGISFPHRLRVHELPHWPTEMSMAELSMDAQRNFDSFLIPAR